METGKKVVFIKDWILNYVNSMPKKAESLVIGISGGIDSSVSQTRLKSSIFQPLPPHLGKTTPRKRRNWTSRSKSQKPLRAR